MRGHLIEQLVSIQKLSAVSHHTWSCVVAPACSFSLSLLFSLLKMLFVSWGQHGRCGQGTEVPTAQRLDMPLPEHSPCPSVMLGLADLRKPGWPAECPCSLYPGVTGLRTAAH